MTANNQEKLKHHSPTNIFNIQPDAVKKWVNNLPLGSTGESSKQIYHALRQVNQQINSLDHQLEFLETITPTLALLYPRLSQYFTDVSLPLEKKTRNVIHITNALINEILQGYQTVIKTLISKKPFGWKKPFSLALHRSLIYSSQIFYTQNLTYQPNSKGAWHDVYWCYQQAEKLKLLNKSYPNHTENKTKTSIDYEFKKLLLLNLISVNDIGHKNMQIIFNLMPIWVKHSELLTKEADDKKTCFTLNLLSDVAPYLVGTRNDGTQATTDRHFLSTFKLQNLLTKYLDKITDQGTIIIGNNSLSAQAINSLLSNWSRKYLRKEERKNGTGFVDIVTGITAIHFVLTKQDQPLYDEASVTLPENIVDFESTLTIEPIQNIPNNDTLNLNHFIAKSDQADDIWGKVYENSINASVPEAHWTESGAHKVYNFTKSILLDYSKNGYRLSVNDNKVDRLKLNELVAVREHALAPWALTQVKWIHFTQKGDVQFGLRILTHHVLPVHIRYHANQTLSKPLPCLLGLDKKDLMLFVPTLPTNLKGKKLQLEHHEQHSHIHLSNKILSTPAFDIYQIHEPTLQEHPSSNENLKTQHIIEPNTQTNLSDKIWDNF